MAYQLTGDLFEVCSCRTLCPCWIGEDPDGGSCDGVLAWKFESGSDIDGVDVAGCSIALVGHIPGNFLDGNFKAAIYIGDQASPEQEEALLKVYTGKSGGPVADLASLVGEVVSVERTAITLNAHEGSGTVEIGQVLSAEFESFKGPEGSPTKLVDALLSTIPGAPVFIAKASRYRSKNSKLGVDLELKGHNAVQSTFRLAS